MNNKKFKFKKNSIEEYTKSLLLNKKDVAGISAVSACLNRSDYFFGEEICELCGFIQISDGKNNTIIDLSVMDYEDYSKALYKLDILKNIITDLESKLLEYKEASEIIK